LHKQVEPTAILLYQKDKEITMAQRKKDELHEKLVNVFNSTEGFKALRIYCFYLRKAYKL